jgi:hypothetical protein
MSAPSYIVTAPADYPDAPLVALCNEATTLYYGARRLDRAAEPTGPTNDPKHRQAIRVRVDAWHALKERITFMPATTHEGVRVKSRPILTPPTSRVTQ